MMKNQKSASFSDPREAPQTSPSTDAKDQENARLSSETREEVLPAYPWAKGDAWEIVYKILTASPHKSATPPPRYEEHRWRYEVETVTQEGRVLISGRRIHNESDVHKTKLELAAKTSQLLSIVNPPHVDNNPDQPFLPLVHGMSAGRNAAWPSFPLQHGTVVFGDGEATQSMTAFQDYVEVTIMRRGLGLGIMTERTAFQHWDKGRPWWSTMTVRSLTTSEDEPYEILELEGKVVAWHLAQESKP